MKNRIIILTLFSVILASCNNKPKKEEQTKVSSKMTEPSTCYSYAKDSNNVQMRIKITNNLASGELLYNYFEKDKNTGTFEGEMKGDTLFADYIFKSEGQSSVREIAFLKNGDTWNEGFGAVEVKEGKTIFKDKNTLSFENNMPLSKTECNLDEKGNLMSLSSVWSSIKDSDVDLAKTATRLNPIEANEKNPAYLIFSDDRLKAELFLPISKKSLMLERTGKEGNYIWTNGEFELITWKGYVLRKDKKAVYAGS